MSKTLTLRPRLSEKTYGQSAAGVYVVEVPTGTNKHAVARAVEQQFEVKVVKVNLTNIAGKSKRIVSISGKRYKNADGRRNDVRKAYVTLAKGNRLPFFDAIEEEIQKEETVQEKVDKAAEKQAAKTAKKAPKKAAAPKAESKPKPEAKPEAKPAAEVKEAEPVVEEPKVRRGWRIPSLKRRHERRK